MSSFYVVLDASVLFPVTLRDILVQCAAEGLYRPFWSEEILNEVERRLVSKKGIAEEKAKQHMNKLRAAFPEAIVEFQSYSPFIAVMPNDLDDRHVLAAAVASKSQVVVTSNLRHFPNHALAPLAIEAQSPDEFLKYQFDLEQNIMIGIIKELIAYYKRPVEEFLGVVRTYAPTFVRELEPYLKDS